MAISKEKRNFAIDFEKTSRGVAQLVAYLVWDQGVAGSNPVAPTLQAKAGSKLIKTSLPAFSLQPVHGKASASSHSLKNLLRSFKWSPRQISGVLKKEGVSVSHQYIYNMIHADASGELARHTRHKFKYRRRPKRKPFPIADRTSIHLRPEQAVGKRFGDFEMDLIVDRHNHTILTIVERSTNMLFMTKLAHGKKAEPLAKEIRQLLLPYKKHIKSIKPARLCHHAKCRMNRKKP